MNKSDFEKLGWIFYFEFSDVYEFEKGDVWKEKGQGAFLKWYSNENRIIITTTDEGSNMDGPNCSVKYNGRCDSLETYRLVCDLIDFKL